MKKLCFIILLFCGAFAHSQNAAVNFSFIDWQAQYIDASRTDTLAKRLTSHYATELEKVRSIYSWIATHISYNMGIFNRKTSPVKYFPEIDTAFEWKSADEMVADRVLKRRVAVCDGYARLFKTLCEYSGLQSELVLGYVRVDEGSRHAFRTNHTWNAVMIDGVWRLVDVTWGSGFVTWSNEFVQKMDDFYFLTPPAEMIRDHYPEDPKWALLNNPPSLREFKNSPFRCKAFVKYGIVSTFPSTGLIETMPGDTVHIELQLSDVEKARKVASSNYADELPERYGLYEVVEPHSQKGKKVVYKYVVNNPSVSYLKLVYNQDVILHYKIKLKEVPGTELSLN